MSKLIMLILALTIPVSCAATPKKKPAKPKDVDPMIVYKSMSLEAPGTAGDAIQFYMYGSCIQGVIVGKTVVTNDKAVACFKFAEAVAQGILEQNQQTH